MVRDLSSKIHAWYTKVSNYGTVWSFWWTCLVFYYLCRSSLPRPFSFNEEHIYEKEWDMLILLDGCTEELLQDMSHNYDFLTDIKTIRSVGSGSEEWMESTFTDEYTNEIENTAYITGNPHSDIVFQNEPFQYLDEVWKYQWDDESGTIRPEPITDQAIRYMRNNSPDRVILHYMQPHFPSLAAPELRSKIEPEKTGEAWEGSIWERLRKGKVEQQDVEQAYRDNLRIVLDNIEVLLQNVDCSSVVISADHGNAMGEWGIYGHHGYTPISSLRNVPWCETKAIDTGEYNPDPIKQTEQGETKKRLQALGYISNES